MDSSNNGSDYSSDFSDSVKRNSSDSTTSSVTAEASGYTTETADSDDDAVPIAPYQFEPSTELLDNSSEESGKEGEENNERLLIVASSYKYILLATSHIS